MQKHILVIGGTKGIGLASVEQLVKQGYTVHCVARNIEGQSAAQHYYQADVLKDALPELDIPLSGLVYCPGSINLKPFKQLKVSDFEKDFAINVTSAVRVLQQYERNLKAAEHASVVLFSTVAVQTGMGYHASVAASKGAIEGLGRSLAAEWAPTVRVNTIAPSLVQTDLAARLIRTEKQIEASAQRHPLKRIGQAQDIAACVSYLISEQSSWVSGQVHKIDGGMSSIKTL